MGKTRLRLASATILAGFAIVATTPLTTPAIAAGTCATHGNFFDGHSWDGVHNLPDGFSPEGASAAVTVRTGALCSGDSTSANDNTVWTMLAENGSVADAGYAQIGYLRNPTTGAAYHFSEWHTTGGATNFALRNIGAAHSWQRLPVLGAIRHLRVPRGYKHMLVDEHWQQPQSLDELQPVGEQRVLPGSQWSDGTSIFRGNAVLAKRRPGHFSKPGGLPVDTVAKRVGRLDLQLRTIFRGSLGRSWLLSHKLQLHLGHDGL